ncbi:hypothetical protein CEUSTIGMA_g12275.t1 [Chlamydomonas eustigma]|uniref:Peptidylprolyl isomerase n=1 Tax=Chlamydomonas eustigma TaxID=1157962 RepID=A0A250XP42_9CHLO|nr:hypothetical protein CEUSTIGMA_g12275.t1 [Chlamydomonas eustigma]|eukprot:GAX84854.1 hypothetical protein CEUSTIGMA_g12275.t1 [Chlamydomonas eustigma]
MGKKQHQKDRAYRTATEWRTEGGGYKERGQLPFKRLPYHCCAITFTPFEEPVCTEDGIVMDVVNAVPYVMKYKKHPVTGEPLHLKDLIKLNFHKNQEGSYHCPVMDKVFTEHTHIVAIKATGNVYCWEAVEELNIKAKSWKDLLTDEPISRKDIIHIQDPLNIQQRSIEAFDHVKRDLHLDDDDEEADQGGSSTLRNTTEDMRRALSALKTQEAKDAFASGGGGKRAEAMNLLAAVKAAAAAKADRATNGAANKKEEVNSAVTTSASTGPGDWRMRAPERSTEGPAFKPGAHTWDTEDQVAVAKLAAAAAQKPKSKYSASKAQNGQTGGKEVATVGGAMVGGGGTAGTSAGGGTAMNPQKWYEAQGHVRWVEGAHTTGGASRSFTSSVMEAKTKNERQMTRFNRNPDKKGYVRMHTNLGEINIELHSDLAPRTCENFLALCDMGYYNNTVFHRSIRNFMIQGGDPLGTGLGGESIYGKTFKDELDSRLLHNGRGVLSMANSGPGTNGSQFFITYKSCQHLNYKHSVFGRVVGGFEVLSLMEKVDTDDEDRPLQEIKITGVTVFTNPFYEMEEEEKRKAEAEQKRKVREEAGASSGDPDAKVGKWFSNPSGELGVDGSTSSLNGSGVGKYLGTVPLLAPPASASLKTGVPKGPTGVDLEREVQAMPPPIKKAKTEMKGSFGNFDTW